MTVKLNKVYWINHRLYVGPGKVVEITYASIVVKTPIAFKEYDMDSRTLYILKSRASSVIS